MWESLQGLSLTLLLVFGSLPAYWVPGLASTGGIPFSVKKKWVSGEGKVSEKDWEKRREGTPMAEM